MITINSCNIHPISLQLKHEIPTAHGYLKQRELLILEICSTSNMRVFSECSALAFPGYHPESLAQAKQCLEQRLIPQILHTPITPKTIGKDLLRLAPKNPFAVAALEMGIWVASTPFPDGQVQGKGWVAGRIQGDRLRQEISTAHASSAQKFKVKVSPQSLENVLEILEQERVFEKFSCVALDGNQSFKPEDLSFLDKIAAYPFRYLEEPCATNDWASLSELKKRLPTPIFLDETIQFPSDLESVFAQDSWNGLVIKPAKFGGIQASLEVVERLKTLGKEFVVGGLYESGIGRCFALGLDRILDAQIPCDLSPEPRYFEHDTAESFTVEPDWQSLR